jgi:hypothetical protein
MRMWEAIQATRPCTTFDIVLIGAWCMVHGVHGYMGSLRFGFGAAFESPSTRSPEYPKLFGD